jgi:glycerophosphoryl diester phosphodiesterase
VIYANGMQRQVTIQSFDWRTLQRVQRIAPEIPTVYLSAQQSSSTTSRAAQPEGRLGRGFQAKDHGIRCRAWSARGRIWSRTSATSTSEGRRSALRWGSTSSCDGEQTETSSGCWIFKVDGLISDRPRPGSRREWTSAA